MGLCISLTVMKDPTRSTVRIYGLVVLIGLLFCNYGFCLSTGGRRGFSQVVWKVKSHRQSGSSPSVSLQYHSRDGEQGFPGDLRVTVTYAIPEPYRLTVDMKATAINKPTPVNLAQHSYWNLAGHNSGNILSHELQLFASHTTPVGQHLIPTGEIASVKRTPYDFLEPHPINAQISSLPAGSKGYDINYAVDGYRAKRTRPVAAVYSPRSGRRMELSSDAPGVQLYTGNYLHDVNGKGGFLYQNHAGLCLETQGFPDSVNHPNFPSQIVFPGGTYKHHMVYAFSVAGGGGLGTPKCRKRSA